MKDSDNRKRAIKQEVVISLILFFLALAPRALTLDAFFTIDEGFWVGVVQRSLAALLNGDFAATYQARHPGVTVVWTVGMGFLVSYLAQLGIGEGILANSTDFQQFLEKVYTVPVDVNLVIQRFPLVLITSASVVLVYFFVKKLFDNKIAFLCAILLAFDPLHLAYSRLILPDALVASFMTLSLLCFMVYLEWNRSLRYTMFSGFAAGLAFLSKNVSLLLIPIICFLTVMAYFTEVRSWRELRPEKILKLALALVVWGAAAMLVFYLLWPAMWVNPGGTSHRVFGFADYTKIFTSSLQYIFDYVNKILTPSLAQKPESFFGQSELYPLEQPERYPDPGPLFYPIALLFKVTPLTLLGVVASPIFLFRQRKGPGEKAQKGAEMVMLIAYIFLFALIISFWKLKFDRFLLPIFPAIEILSALGLYNLIRTVIHKLGFEGFKKNYPWIVASLLIVLLQAGFSLPYHPYYLTYYNPLMGGGSQACKMIIVGLGEGLDEAARYLNRKEDPTDITVASWYKGCLARFFVGETWDLSNKRNIFWRDIDYMIFYINQVQRQLPDPQFVQCFHTLEPEHTVRIKGIDYAWIYRVPRPLPDCFMPAQHVKQTQFGDQILFLGYDIVKNQGPFDGKLRINLYWRALREMGEDYTIYLKLINDAYHIWGQQDSRPYWDGLPTNSWKKGQVVGDKREIDILPGTPPGLYRVEIIIYDLYSGQTLEPVGGEGLLLGPVEIPRWESLSIEALGIEHPIRANLGDNVSFLGYNIESGFRPGDNIHLTLFWQCLEEMEQSYTVFTHLVDAGDNIVAQKDNPPVDGFYPTTKWEMGEIVRDQYDLVIPSDVPPGEYRLKVGMYLVETGERLNILKDGVPLPDNRILLQPVAVGGAE